MRQALWAMSLTTLTTLAVTAAAAPIAPGKSVADDLIIEVFLSTGNLETKTTGLSFAIVVEVASTSGVPHPITVRTALPAGLRYGGDAPNLAEGCAGTDTTVCTMNMQPNPAGTIGFGWQWDIVAERAGFYEMTATVEAEEADPDLSNNRDTFRFEVVAGQPPPSPPPPAAATAGAPKLTPSNPKAGSLVSATVRVSAGGAPIRPTGLACSGSIGTTKLRGAGKAATGSATCVYHTPRSAKGKTLRGTVSFTARGTRFTKRFSVKLG